MAFYKICPDCGASLDPGEKCDCRDEKDMEQDKRREFFSRHLKMEPKAGKLAFVFDSGEVFHESKSYC